MPDFSASMPPAFANSLVGLNAPVNITPAEISPAGAIPLSEDAWLVATGLTPNQWLALGLPEQRAVIRQVATAGNAVLSDAQAEAIAARVTGQLAAMTTTAAPPAAPDALPPLPPPSLPPPPDRSDASVTCSLAPPPPDLTVRVLSAVPVQARGYAPAGQAAPPVTAPVAVNYAPTTTYPIPLKDAGIPFMLAAIALVVAFSVPVEVPIAGFRKPSAPRDE